MLKIATIVWPILAVAFAGALILVVLSIPSLNAQDGRLLIAAAAVGAILALPVAAVVAKRILALTVRS